MMQQIEGPVEGHDQTGNPRSFLVPARATAD
jgi:hypothetical protein